MLLNQHSVCVPVMTCLESWAGRDITLSTGMGFRIVHVQKQDEAGGRNPIKKKKSSCCEICQEFCLSCSDSVQLYVLT